MALITGPTCAPQDFRRLKCEFGLFFQSPKMVGNKNATPLYPRDVAIHLYTDTNNKYELQYTDPRGADKTGLTTRFFGRLLSPAISKQL
jgi:hypothetical protein